MIRRAGLALAFLLGTTAALQAQQSGQGVECSKCHANRAFLQGKRAASGDTTLFVTDSLLDGSVHAGLACADCHPGFDEGYPHEAERTAAPCQSCHDQAGRAWEISIHAADAAAGGAGATCVDCHGSHRVLSPEDRNSPTYALNVAEMCARCHADPEIVGQYFNTPQRAEARQVVQRYFQTVHGTAITKGGLVVAATCNDCHRSHDILPPEDPRSSVNRSHIPETCGSCHVGILQEFETSAHGEALADSAGERAPVCTSCHTSHEIVQADQPAWFLGVVEECGECHQKLYNEYLQTYHGKVTRLGSGLAAQCSECHTAHRMLPASNPASTVNRAHLVETCRQCHAGANENFVQYYAHGDHADRRDFPRLFYPWLFMTVLLVGVFAFFGTHTLLWLVRSGIDALRGRGKQEEP